MCNSRKTLGFPEETEGLQKVPEGYAGPCRLPLPSSFIYSLPQDLSCPVWPLPTSLRAPLSKQL